MTGRAMQGFPAREPRYGRTGSRANRSSAISSLWCRRPTRAWGTNRRETCTTIGCILPARSLGLRTIALVASLLGGMLPTAQSIWRMRSRTGCGRDSRAGAQAHLTSVQKVTDRSIRTMRSERFQAVGDASESFIKITLDDCERIADGYFSHFKAKGFDIRSPDRRLTLLVFVDERPFRSLVKGVPQAVVGVYKRNDNWLVLFDFRNVTCATCGAAIKPTCGRWPTKRPTF